MQEVLVYVILIVAIAYVGWRVYTIIRSKDKGCCGCPDQEKCPYCQDKSVCKEDCSCCQGKSE